MTWSISKIRAEWLNGAEVPYPEVDVLRAFSNAEEARGREWVLGTTHGPGGWRRFGFAPFIRVYQFGTRIESLRDAHGAATLLARLARNEPGAESELAAIHLLRSKPSSTELEIAPEIRVGRRNRRPDFRIRRIENDWTYVEVTQLNRSEASERAQSVLDRIVSDIATINSSFLLEIVFWRDPIEDEEAALVRQAHEACQAADGERRDVGDLASILVKSGDANVLVPTFFPDDRQPKVALSRSLIGPGGHPRQVMARLPFTDQRAEAILTAEARQLPKDQSGLVIVDATAQPTAFESWSKLIPPRFTRKLHTRVAGLLLFGQAIMGTVSGLAWITTVRLMQNEYAAKPLAQWIIDVVEETRSETARLTGRPD
jgi:hypothetical protein